MPSIKHSDITNPFRGLCTAMPGTEDTFFSIPTKEITKAISGLIYNIRNHAHFFKIHSKIATENGIAFLIDTAKGAAIKVFAALGIDRKVHNVWSKTTYKLDISGDRISNLGKYGRKSCHDLSQLLRLYWFKELNERLQNAFLRSYLLDRELVDGPIRRIKEDDLTEKYMRLRNGDAGPDEMPTAFRAPEVEPERMELPVSIAGDSEASDSDASTIVDESPIPAADNGSTAGFWPNSISMPIVGYT